MRKTLIFAAITAAAAGSTSAAARAPVYSASIVRTALGIPHITARDWRGIGYGVAYAYGQDNLCLLAEEFATVAGQRSQNFGAGAKAVLGFEPVDNQTSDLFFRSAIDLPALRRGARTMAPEQTQLSAGYVAGYNRLLRDLGTAGVPASCRGKAWVRPITGDDMLRSLPVPRRSPTMADCPRRTPPGSAATAGRSAAT
jgi:acyl-homoserine-lactone acylase